MNRTTKLLALFVLFQVEVSGVSAATSYESEYKKVVDCMESRDFGAAIVHCRTMQALAKTTAEKTNTLLLLEDAASSKHDYPVSIQAMTQAIALTGKSNSFYLDTLYWRRGKAYSANGNYEKAVADYTVVEPNRKVPRDVVNLMRDRSFAYEKLKQYDKSIADITKSIKFVDQILGSKADAIRIERVKGEKIEYLYKRAKLFTMLGKTEDAKRDKALADKLTEAW